MKKGGLIKELRLKKGYSQKDLSFKSGLSERTIQRVENNEVVPSLYTLKVLGEILEENFLMVKGNNTEFKYGIFIIPKNFNSFINQVRNEKKIILISLVISFIISFFLSSIFRDFI